jgi:hypothetical protein
VIVEDNVKIDIAEIEYEHTNWIHLAQDNFQWRSFVNTVRKVKTLIFLVSEKLLNSQAGFNFGKAIPVLAWTGPESSNRLRLPDFQTISTCGW